MNKTIYIRDEDVSVWERARELYGEKLSPLLIYALRTYISKKEAETKGFERIEIRYNDSIENNLPRAKAFHGKWVVPPTDEFGWERDDNGDAVRFSAAVTAKGAAVFYCWNVSREDGGKYHERFYVLPSLEIAVADNELNRIAREAIERLGVPVDELDI